VSENDNCHCTGTTKEAVKFMRRNAWRGKPWGDLGKLTQKVRMLHTGADCSKYGRQQQGRPDRWQWSAMYNGHSASIWAVSCSFMLHHELKITRKNVAE